MTRSTRKISPTWVCQTRQYVLKFLHAIRFPSVEPHRQRGKTFAYPERLIRLIGVLVVKCKEPTDLDIHRITCRGWHACGGRKVRLSPISARQWRARGNNIGYQLGTAPG